MATQPCDTLHPAIIQQLLIVTVNQPASSFYSCHICIIMVHLKKTLDSFDIWIDTSWWITIFSKCWCYTMGIKSCFCNHITIIHHHWNDQLHFYRLMKDHFVEIQSRFSIHCVYMSIWILIWMWSWKHQNSCTGSLPTGYWIFSAGSGWERRTQAMINKGNDDHSLLSSFILKIRSNDFSDMDFTDGHSTSIHPHHLYLSSCSNTTTSSSTYGAQKTVIAAHWWLDTTKAGLKWHTLSTLETKSLRCIWEWMV